MFPAIRARSAAAELPPSILLTKEAAGVSRRTLEKHRIYGTGPNDQGDRPTSDPGGTTIAPAKPVDKASRIGPVPAGSTGVKRNAPGPPARLGTPAAARLVGVSPRTLEKHRIYGTGPNYSKISGRVFYAIGDLTEWAKRGARLTTSDPGKTTVLGACKASTRSKGDPNRCAIAACHGSWERPDNGFADRVLASAAKGDAPDFEMPAGTGNDTGEVNPTSRNTTPATAPSATPDNDERARQSPLFPVMAKPLRQFAKRASRKRPACRRRTEERRSNGPSDSRRAACRQRVCAAFRGEHLRRNRNDETSSSPQ